MASARPDASVNGWNADFLETMHARWLADPDSVDAQWQQFFQGFELGLSRPAAGAAASPADGHDAQEISSTFLRKQRAVDQLIERYRDIGHLAADLDPLGTQRPFPADLNLDAFGLSDADLDTSFDPGTLPLESPSKLSSIIAMLEETYCRTVGVEYMHIHDLEQRRWLQKHMETTRNQPPMSKELKLAVLASLIESDGFESFVDTRFKGAKRFGLEGGETLIAMLDAVIDIGPLHGVKEFTLGMAHRGRINVLVNVLHKSYDQIFTEFDEAWVEDFVESGGDVKYHRGYSTDHTTSTGQRVRLTLSPNPSHLEFVNAVVLGRARAKQRLLKDTQREQVVPVLIHGDASFPGQGVVAECFNMMKLDGYDVGGSIHFIINNQIGFTTNQSDATSGKYCTDIAKFMEVPVFHVNGHDPEACVAVTRLAMEYRQAFKRDIVIDLWCYRKYGHNETDEPTFTQPLMYERIRKQKPVLRHYAEQLIAENVISQQAFDDLAAKLRASLDEAQTRTKSKPVEPSVRAFNAVWQGLTEDYNDEPVETGVSREKLDKVAAALGSVPDGFNVHKALQKVLTTRREAIAKDARLDWGTGEMLAYGTLLLEGHAVRLTGQDVERGTFSHRHAVLFEQKSGEGYTALNAIDQLQARFCIHNSPLTESACVGFEYGYSLGDPKMLILWEAQFGDFANGAQVYFDQFLASAEVKWNRCSGLTLLLPHGYEGQGPEHSSARLERFLVLCADNNMQVVNPTTPAQMFHLLRRQLKRNFRKPLVVMTPKSLLRHPRATSSLNELIDGRFHRVLDDPAIKTAADAAAVTRVVLCSGKVYYDLAEHNEKTPGTKLALIRVEQLYPYPADSLREVLARYSNAKEFVWVQEEPRNMGAWRQMHIYAKEVLDLNLTYIGREAKPSPAVASKKMHEQEQEKIKITAIGLATESDLAAAGRSATESKKSAPVTAKR